MKSTIECNLRWLLFGLLVTGSCGAAMVAGPAAPPGARVSTLPAAAAPSNARNPAQGYVATAPELDLVGGVVQGVDFKQGTLTLGGKPVGLHPTRLRVVQQGGRAQAGAAILRPGMRIRFALEPTTAPVRRIVLIYIDG